MLGRLSVLGDWAPLILRIVIGIILIAHGKDKVFGGMAGFTNMVSGLGMPAVLAYAAAYTEFFGGTLILLGLLTRWASLFVVIEFVVIIAKVHWQHGLKGQGGFEFPLAILAGALSLLLLGGGLLSMDRHVVHNEF